MGVVVVVVVLGGGGGGESPPPTVTVLRYFHHPSPKTWFPTPKLAETKERTKKNTGLFGNFSQHRGGGVSSFPKLL